MGDTTDQLTASGALLTLSPDAREMDALISTGEQISAAMLAMAIQQQGVGAISLTGWQAGIQTDGVYGNATITGISCQRLESVLNRGSVAVVTGFQGISPAGDITTLGRGGSDTTAVALAVFLQADMCQIYTDVAGVYDRDPRKCSAAKQYTHISYEEMLRLIDRGAQILHRPCVELAQKHSLAIQVMSALEDAPGTLVG